MENTRQSIQDVMKNQYLLNVFTEKCMQECSTENLLFLEHVGKYRKIKDDKQRLAKGKFIVEAFLLPGSKSEINVNREMAQMVQDEVNDRYAPLELFDQLEKEIELLINDTMMRYTKEITEKSLEEKELSSLATTIVDNSYYDTKNRESKGRSLDTRKKNDLEKLEESLKQEKKLADAQKRSKFLFAFKKVTNMSFINGIKK